MSRQTWSLLMRRQREQRNLPETVEVWRPTRTTDSAGGFSESYSRVTTAPGRVDRLSEASALIAERLGQKASATIVLPFDVAVTAGDELRVGAARYSFVGSDAGSTDPVTLSVAVAEAR
jgi:head-tail adaptor